MKRLMTMLTALSMYAQEGTHLTKGYNALQAGHLDGKLRARAYTNVGVQNKNLHLHYQGLNELGNNYLFGRESLRIGSNKIPVDAIVVSRITGSANDAQLLDTAFGARYTITTKSGVYGFVDVVKHIGEGASKYCGLESVVFAGKRIKGWNFETTQAVKQGKRPFSEVEVLTPIKKYGKFNIRGYVRYESPNKDITFGLQGQL
jgi:hypothetical protein